MELLVTLSNIDRIQKYHNACVDGFIYGSLFSLRFNYSFEDVKKITEYCNKYNLKAYISIDAFISENDLPVLYQYFEFLSTLKISGIYFNDLSIINVANVYGLADKLIYDPDTLMTNSLDSSFILSNNIGVVCARELTLDEVKKILMNNPQKIDMQIFGHLKMSYSKRKFLTNYFTYLNIEKDFNNKRNLHLEEETRDYFLPISENEFGTMIYSDYIFMMFKEFVEIKDYIKRAIIDDTFINTDVIVDAISAARKTTNINSEFILYYLKNKYRDIEFSTGYLYEKTNKVKDE